MDEAKEYPVEVKEVQGGIVFVLLKGLGFEGKEEKRLAVPSNQIPTDVLYLIQTGTQRHYKILTLSPFNTQSWEWSVSPQSDPPTINPDDLKWVAWGDLVLVCKRIDEERRLAQFGILRDWRQIEDLYVCALADLPPVVLAWAKHCHENEGYWVNVPFGMIGDPKQWDFQELVELPSKSPEVDTGLDAGLDADKEQPSYETVDHPPHYNWHPRFECIDVIEEFENVNVAFAIKHLWRLGRKPTASAVEDLNKAIWYLQRERARLTKEKRDDG